MNSDAPNAMIARLKTLPGAPNAVIAKGRNRGKLQMLLSLRKNALTSLFKEVRVFKVKPSHQKHLAQTRQGGPEPIKLSMFGPSLSFEIPPKEELEGDKWAPKVIMPAFFSFVCLIDCLFVCMCMCVCVCLCVCVCVFVFGFVFVFVFFPYPDLPFLGVLNFLGLL